MFSPLTLVKEESVSVTQTPTFFSLPATFLSLYLDAQFQSSFESGKQYLLEESNNKQEIIIITFFSLFPKVTLLSETLGNISTKHRTKDQGNYFEILKRKEVFNQYQEFNSSLTLQGDSPTGRSKRPIRWLTLKHHQEL